MKMLIFIAALIALAAALMAGCSHSRSCAPLQTATLVHAPAAPNCAAAAGCA